MRFTAGSAERRRDSRINGDPRAPERLRSKRIRDRRGGVLALLKPREIAPPIRLEARIPPSQGGDAGSSPAWVTIGVVPRSTRRRPRGSSTTRGRCPEGAARSSSTDIQRGPEGRPARREHSLVEPRRGRLRQAESASGHPEPRLRPRSHRRIGGPSWELVAQAPLPRRKGGGHFPQVVKRRRQADPGVKGVPTSPVAGGDSPQPQRRAGGLLRVRGQFRRTPDPANGDEGSETPWPDPIGPAILAGERTVALLGPFISACHDQ